MDTAKTQPVVTIAGKPYQVHYRLSDLRFIEAEAAEPGRGFMSMLGGNFIEKAAIVWGGIRSKNRGTRELQQVIDLLEAHQEQGGNWSGDVFMPCAAAALYSGLGGNVPESKVDAILRLTRQAAGEDVEEGEPGKAVRAAE